MAKLASPFALPLSRKWKEDGHSGVDWAKAGGAALGAVIRASGPGIVSFAGFNNTRSGFVTSVTYDNGVLAMACHRQSAGSILKGARVNEGTDLAFVGYTGNVIPAGPGGAHLHFEVYVAGRLVNPGDYFDFGRVVGKAAPAGVPGFNAHDEWVQAQLNKLGYGLLVDGVRGVRTIAAVKDFQQRNGLVVDGIPGQRTTEMINQRLTPPATGRPIIRVGSTGQHVTDLQNRLRTAYPLYARHIKGDGVFGAATQAAVREFQRRAGLVADGIVGAQTWKGLGL